MRRLVWIVLALSFLSAAYLAAVYADCHTDTECGCVEYCN